jgi:hypothetical protein
MVAGQLPRLGGGGKNAGYAQNQEEECGFFHIFEFNLSNIRIL